jgi:hypothetical protein
MVMGVYLLFQVKETYALVFLFQTSGSLADYGKRVRLVAAVLMIAVVLIVVK